VKERDRWDDLGGDGLVMLVLIWMLNIRCGDLRCIHLALYRGQWRVRINTVMTFRCYKIQLISWLAEELLVFRKELCPIEFLRLGLTVRHWSSVYNRGYNPQVATQIRYACAGGGGLPYGRERVFVENSVIMKRNKNSNNDPENVILNLCF
jgi:hypothetical protein